MEDALPERLGRFEVRGRVGGGGMGEVYRVWDPAVRRLIALKVLKFSYPRALHYFKREFRAVARLSHPNLVALHDLHVVGGRYFYTMELIDGVDLYVHVNGHNRVVSDTAVLTRPERLARLRDAFVQLLRGLAYLHGQGRIHRDIKPSNILVDVGGHLKLVDFGIIKEVLPGGEGQSLSQVFGTSTYFSPEQSLGSRVTAATDLYAAGVVLYELLAGVPPFEGEGPEVAESHRSSPPPSLVARVPGLPADLALVCMELLSKDPAHRPSAVEGLEMLKADLDVEPPDEAEFVGRRGARKVLHRALDAVRGGRGRLVLIEGPTGIGKSALVDAFGQEATLYGASLFTGTAVHRDHVPYRGLDTAVERLAEAYRKQVARALRALSVQERGALIGAFSFLGELLPAAEHGDTEQRQVVGQGLGHLLTLMGEQRLLILAVEHLHLIDDALCDAFEQLVGGERMPPCLLVATVRTGAVAPNSRVAGLLELISAHPRAERVSLGPLAPEDVRRLVEDRLEDAPAGLAEHILAQTEGVPLLVREMIRAVRRDPHGDPPSLEEIVWSRLDALDRDAQRVLHAVSLSPRPVQGLVLERACSLDADGLYEALVALTQAGFVHTEGTQDGQITAVPVHRRIMEVVRQRLTETQRRLQHEMLARAHQASDSEPGTFAYPWRAAGQADRAARFALLSIDGARQTNRWRRAAQLAQLALTGDHPPRRRAELRVIRADCLARDNRYLEAAATLETVARDDPAEAERWRVRKCQLYLMGGDLEAFDRHAERLPPESRAPLADLLVPLAPLRAMSLVGEAPGAAADLVRARLHALRDEPAAVQRAVGLIRAAAAEGQSSDPRRRAAFTVAHAIVCRALGDLPQALELVDRALAALTETLGASDLWTLRLNLGRTEILLDRGRVTEARSAGRALLRLLRTHGLRGLQARACLVLARVHLAAGELTTADRLIAEARRSWPAVQVSLPGVYLALADAERAFCAEELATSVARLAAVDRDDALAGLLRLRPVALRRARLAARICAVRALKLRDAEQRAALQRSWARLRDRVPRPDGWLEILAALGELSAGQPQYAHQRMTLLTEVPDRAPADGIQWALMWAVTGAARAALGRDHREAWARAEELLAEAGATHPPEMCALREVFLG